MDRGALLPGPALRPWLRRCLREARAPGLVITPGGGAGWVGAALHRVLRPLAIQSALGGDAPLDLLVVIATLDGDGPPEAIGRLSAGARVIECTHAPPWRLAELVAPWRRAPRLRWAVERRARVWLEAGLYGLSQWSPVEPGGVLVSDGRWRARPGAFRAIPSP